MTAFAWLVGATVICAQDVSIEQQPQSVNVVEGDTIRLMVGASGPDPLTYQWYYLATQDAEAQLLEGQTQAALTIANAQLANKGFYFVYISESVESDLAEVTVQKKAIPLLITQQPAGVTIKEGDRLSIAAQAQGEAPLTYQWYFSSSPGVKPSSPVAGQLAATFLIASALPVHSGAYLVRVTDAAGASVESGVAQVVVNPATVFPRMLADTGFRPERDGFGFENYGNDWKPTNLTAEEIRRLFGDRACATINGQVCVLTPPGQKWMEQQSDGMNGGHCEGMAVASILMFANKVDLNPFGGGTVFGWDIRTNVRLQREIGYWFVTQATSPASDRAIKGTPVEIVDLLIGALKPGAPETYTVGVYAPPPLTGGHAVTPYAVEDMGNNIHHVLVYDNNHPGKTRRLVVDRTKNTWELPLSTNPDEVEKPWHGDANSKTFDLTPSSTRITVQDCPFCEDTGNPQVGKLGIPSERFSEIYVEGNGAALVIIDAQGRRYGEANGVFVTEIPGVTHRVTKSNDQLWKDDSSPVYLVPVGMAFKLQLNGLEVSDPTETAVTFIGPGYDVAVEDIMLDPGQVDTIEFDADGTGVAYTSSGIESPDIVLGFDGEDADFEFVVRGVEMDAGATLRVKVDEIKGTLALTSTGNKQTAVYELSMGRFDDEREQEFFNDEVELGPNDSAIIDFGRWVGDKSFLPLLIDEGRDGSIDRTVQLVDEEQSGGAALVLRVMMDAGGIVRIVWTDDGSGPVLESSSRLGGIWTAVSDNQIETAGPARIFTEPASGDARFYRLRRN